MKKIKLFFRMLYIGFRFFIAAVKLGFSIGFRIFKFFISPSKKDES